MLASERSLWIQNEPGSCRDSWMESDEDKNKFSGQYMPDVCYHLKIWGRERKKKNCQHGHWLQIPTLHDWIFTFGANRFFECSSEYYKLYYNIPQVTLCKNAVKTFHCFLSYMLLVFLFDTTAKMKGQQRVLHLHVPQNGNYMQSVK